MHYSTDSCLQTRWMKLMNGLVGIRMLRQMFWRFEEHRCFWESDLDSMLPSRGLRLMHLHRVPVELVLVAEMADSCPTVSAVKKKRNLQ